MLTVLAASLALMAGTPAAAQMPMLGGKIVRLVVGFGPGGGHDARAA
jgi:tripartite-type tricarboxylate transporter receptor subunit TctC